MRQTIKHFNTSATILWYLSCQDKPVKCAKICEYMTLMHGIERTNTDVVLGDLVKHKQIKRVSYAMYVGILEFAT